MNVVIVGTADGSGELRTVGHEDGNVEGSGDGWRSLGQSDVQW